MVKPKVRGIAPFLAGSRPSRLHRRRQRERDARRERWFARYVMDDALAMYGVAD